MIDFSGNSASVNIPVPLKKIFDEETVQRYGITDMTWRMAIKPAVRNVVKFSDGRVRIEEIQVFVLRIRSLTQYSDIFTILGQIQSKIMYPSVVFLEYGNKYKIAARKIIDTAAEINKEILKAPYLTSWIRDPASSKKTADCIDAIRQILMFGEGSLKDLYDRICAAILSCEPQFIGSREHLVRILEDLGGTAKDPILKTIDTMKQYEVLNPYSRYQKKKYGDEHRYRYEYEDIWYALTNDERYKKILESRRCSNIEDLIFKVDMKYMEQDQSW